MRERRKSLPHIFNLSSCLSHVGAFGAGEGVFESSKVIEMVVISVVVESVAVVSMAVVSVAVVSVAVETGCSSLESNLAS